MIAMNGMEVIIYIICPAMLVLIIGFGVWTQKSDHPLAVKSREAEYHSPFGEEDDRDYELEREMKEYYANKNFDRRTGRDG